MRMTIPQKNNNTIIRIIIHIVQKEICGERGPREKKAARGLDVFDRRNAHKSFHYAHGRLRWDGLSEGEIFV